MVVLLFDDDEYSFQFKESRIDKKQNLVDIFSGLIEQFLPENMYLYIQEIVSKKNESSSSFEIFFRPESNADLFYSNLSDIEKLKLTRLQLAAMMNMPFHMLEVVAIGGHEIGRLFINIEASVLNNVVYEIIALHKKMVKNNIDIVVEVTERICPSEAGSTFNAVSSLNDAGVLIAIDDYYGVDDPRHDWIKTGCLNYVKVISSAALSKGNYEELIYYSNYLNSIKEESESIRIVVEKVEDLDELLILSSLNIDYLQGYYLSKPESIDDFIKS